MHPDNRLTFSKSNNENFICNYFIPSLNCIACIICLVHFNDRNLVNKNCSIVHDQLEIKQTEIVKIKESPLWWLKKSSPLKGNIRSLQPGLAPPSEPHMYT